MIGGIRERKTDPAVFQMLLHDRGAVVVEDGGQDAGREITDGDLPYPVAQSFGAFKSDQTRADDQHAAVFIDRFFDRIAVVDGQKGKLFIDRIEPFHRRYER